MKEDRLEEFILKNRDEFDSIESINLDLNWKKTQKLGKASKPRKTIWLSIGFLSLMLMTFMAYHFYQTNQKINRLELYVMQSPEYKTEHNNLMQRVSETEKRIDEQKINKEDFEEIFNELKELEQSQINFEADFSEYGNTDQLMKTLFKYYERKTKILEILLFENEKKKYDENINRHEI